MPAIDLTPVVKFDGTGLADVWLSALLELRVDLEFQVPGQVTLRFIDPGYGLAQSNTLQLGTDIEVLDPLGKTALINAEVTAVSVDQREGDQPELVVVGHDRSHRLGRSTEVKTFLQMAYSDIASRLAKDAGLTASVDSTSVQLDYLMQVDSDLGLLTEMARRVGYDWWVDGKTLNFKMPATGTTVNLPLGQDLTSFSVRASGHHPDSVTVDGWDRTNQQQVSGSAQSASSGVAASSTLGDLAAGTKRAFGSATLLTAGLGALSDKEASDLSQALYDRGMACAVSARGVSSGNAGVKLGSTVAVSMAGPLSGTYPVTGVEHVFRRERGFVTRFRAGDRRPISLVDTLTGRGAAGPAHHHPGLSVGVVTNINDPNNLGRVKVRYPGVSSSEESDWARMVAVGGGKNRGTVFIPEVNDEVLVAFEGGDPRQPVVIGGLFGSKSTIPPAQIENGVVQERAFTSRLGHSMTLLDGEEPAKQAIELQLVGGEHTMHLGKDKLNITVPSGLPVNITAGQTSLAFDQVGAVTLKGPNITIQATETLKLQGVQVQVAADAQLQMEGQAQAALKGAVVQVQGSGPVTIAGATVAIN